MNITKEIIISGTSSKRRLFTLSIGLNAALLWRVRHCTCPFCYRYSQDWAWTCWLFHLLSLPPGRWEMPYSSSRLSMKLSGIVQCQLFKTWVYIYTLNAEIESALVSWCFCLPLQCHWKCLNDNSTETLDTLVLSHWHAGRVCRPYSLLIYVQTLVCSIIASSRLDQDGNDWNHLLGKRTPSTQCTKFNNKSYTGEEDEWGGQGSVFHMQYPRHGEPFFFFCPHRH